MNLSSAVGYSVEVAEQSAEAFRPLSTRTLESESRFYSSYSWTLQVFPRLRDIISYLRVELRHLNDVEEEWQQREVETNIFLFCCAISESVDDLFLGKTWDFSKVGVPLGGPLQHAVEVLQRKRSQIRERWLQQLSSWRDAWDSALRIFVHEFLNQAEKAGTRGRSFFGELESLLGFPFPRALLDSRPRIPAAFHGQDLTHYDIIKLGEKFIENAPDRKRPILVVGLRTAGSYFAPLLHAYLSSQGYEAVVAVTIRPKSGVAYREMLCLKRAANKNATAIVIDEPGGTGNTYARGVDCVRRAGFARESIMVLVPIHPTVRDWREKPGYLRLSRIRMVSLEPEEYQKHTFLRPQFAQQYLSAYFRRLGYVEAKIVESSRSDNINRDLANLSEENSQNRLKRAYEVHLRKERGEQEVRFVLAKSVGWGWLSYHAYLAGERLAGFIPPILGLRNGLLYSEWFDHRGNGAECIQRKHVIDTAASYVASRVQKLQLSDDPTQDLTEEGRHFGAEKFTDCLCRAYGGRAIAGLRRVRIRQKLARLRACSPTFIDGRMRQLEWIEGENFLFKSDFEQHGLGKYELSVTDPAYDIAEVILNFGLRSEEEEELITKYVSYSADQDVRRRLFLNKMQAGAWAMTWALSNLADSRLVHRHQEFHQRFTEAWNFLTIQAAHICGNLCHRPQSIRWSSPFVALDVDGVLDKHIFGFPSTTIAGMQALALFHDHGLTVAIDTARTVPEVKEYCRAYGFAGGVAEYGAWAWDAVTGKEIVLLAREDREQLDDLAQRLREIPGVFLSDHYRYSLRAFMYGPDGTVPLPTKLIETLVAKLKLDRLKLHQTSIDTAVTARHVDKGKGLTALKVLVGQEGAETVAVGDTEADLSMFAASHRSYAPGNMTSCRPIAKSMGCKFVGGEYQVGLLQIAQAVVHPKGGECEHCQCWDMPHGANEQELFLSLLKVADQGRWARLVGALLDPLSFRAFVK